MGEGGGHPCPHSVTRVRAFTAIAHSPTHSLIHMPRQDGGGDSAECSDDNLTSHSRRSLWASERSQTLELSGTARRRIHKIKRSSTGAYVISKVSASDVATARWVHHLFIYLFFFV